jgi:ribosomal protein S18 acetylase RimI-like enzyme
VMPNEDSAGPKVDIHLRRLGRADAERFKAMRVYAATESPASVKPTPEEELERPIEEFEKKLSWDSHNFVLGAFDGDQMVGIAGLRREPGKKIHHTATLWGIYVTPRYRARGIAKRLVRAILDIAGGIAEITQIRLSVHTRNAPARQLYTASGFKTYGIERNVIRHGEESFDEELMMMTLR